MILVLPEIWGNHSQAPPPAKKIRKSKNQSYNKWTKLRLHQDPYLRSEKQKREPIPIPIVETGSTLPSFKTKSKQKCNIASHFVG